MVRSPWAKRAGAVHRGQQPLVPLGHPPEGGRKLLLGGDEAAEGVGDLGRRQGLEVVAAHGQVAGGGHLAGDGPQAAGDLALLLGQAQVDDVLLAGRLVVQLQGLHVDPEVVGHGLGHLGEPRRQLRVLGQATATGLLLVHVCILSAVRPWSGDLLGSVAASPGGGAGSRHPPGKNPRCCRLRRSVKGMDLSVSAKTAAAEAPARLGASHPKGEEPGRPRRRPGRRADAVLLAPLLAVAVLGRRPGYLLSHAFWLDEAWVAASVRAPLRQLPMVSSSTPIGWALLLRLVPDVGPPERLRLLPLAFAVAAVVAAYLLDRRLGRAQAVAAGLAAALAPSALRWPSLKQYTADAFVTLLLLW